MDALRDLQVAQAETTNEVKNLVHRMDKQNISVIHLQEDSNKIRSSWRSAGSPAPLLVPMQHELTDHSNGGPLRGRMNAVEEWSTTDRATTAANSHRLNRLWPASYATADVTVYVAALYASDLLNAMKP